MSPRPQHGYSPFLLVFLGLAGFLGGAQPDASVQPASKAQQWEESLLVVPDYGKETILLDDAGKEVLIWKSEMPNGGGARLLKNRSLLHMVNRPLQRPFTKAISGGGLEVLDSESRVVWSFWNATSEHASCGDVLMLPNGNVLTTIVEWKSREEVIQAGRDPKLVDPNGMLIPGIMEVKPNGPTAGLPVWKWSLWNHLYQLKYPEAANYSFPKPKEGCVNINLGKQKRRGWILPFELEYNEKEQLILLISQNQQAWVIDHSTTTAEAATDKGGRFGKGGRLLLNLAAPSTAPERDAFPVMSGWWTGGADLALLRPNSTFAEVTRVGEGWSGEVKNHRATGVKQMPIPKADGSKANIRNARFFADGSLALSSGFQGEIVRLSPSGSLRWRYKNVHNLQTFNVGTGGGASGCCGGGEPEPGSPDKVKAAPVSRLQVCKMPLNK